jgi:hypothetical protein
MSKNPILSLGFPFCLAGTSIALEEACHKHACWILGESVLILQVPKGGDKDSAWKGGKMFAASGNVIFPVNTNFKEVER